MRHFATLSTAKPRWRLNDRSIFNYGGKKRRKPVLSKHDHLFKNEEDVVTVDKTDEVEDQKVSPQFCFCKVCVLSVFNFCVCLPCVVTCLFPCLVLVLPCSRHVLSLCLFVYAMCPDRERTRLNSSHT